MSETETDNLPPEPADNSGGIEESLSEADPSFVTAPASANRSAIMLLAGLLALGGGVLYFMRLRAGPSTAAASVESNDAKKTITEFLSDGSKNITQMRSTLRNTEKIVQQFVNQSSDNQVDVEKLRTNPFQYAEKKKPETRPSDEAAEKARLEAEALKAREREKAEVVRAANDLKVQSIMLAGTKHICMINNRTCAVGEEINGFSIEAIDKNSVTLSQKGLRLKISMKQN